MEANNQAATSPSEVELELGELQSSLFDAAGEGILIMDAASTRILRANRRAGEIHGFGPGEMVGLLARDLLPDPAADELGGLVSRLVPLAGAERVTTRDHP